MSRRSKQRTAGWREWVALPELGVARIKGKLDTGARTSSLHATGIRQYLRDGIPRIRFCVHPRQRSTEPIIVAHGVVIDERAVRSSNGVVELRPVIMTAVSVAGDIWPIELTLTSRQEMGFRLLLGRQALRGHVIVNPGKSFLTSGTGFSDTE